jgi:hypothetical protein
MKRIRPTDPTAAFLRMLGGTRASFLITRLPLPSRAA